jgi:hypothetical protein
VCEVPHISSWNVWPARRQGEAPALARPNVPEPPLCESRRRRRAAAAGAAHKKNPAEAGQLMEQRPQQRTPRDPNFASAARLHGHASGPDPTGQAEPVPGLVVSPETCHQVRAISTLPASSIGPKKHRQKLAFLPVMITLLEAYEAKVVRSGCRSGLLLSKGSV